MYVYIYVYVYIYIYIYIYMYMCIYIYIYIYSKKMVLYSTKYIYIYQGWHGTQMSRFGTYLGSGVTVRYDFGTTGKKKKSTMLGFFSFILNRQ